MKKRRPAANYPYHNYTPRNASFSDTRHTPIRSLGIIPSKLQTRPSPADFRC